MLELLEKLSSQQYHKDIFDALKKQDEQIYQLIVKEYERLHNTIQLIAAENQCSQSVLAALGSIVQNKTTEGFPGSRFHGGCEVVDNIENIAAARARETFDAQYANVQPHSGTNANQIVITALLERDDTILSLGMDQGGHVSHGANVAFSGKFFKVHNYSVNKSNYLLDYDSIKAMAIAFKPKLIICGATAYSRTIDFKKFREIADRVGAYLLADISHIASLVIAGAHPSPVNHAHFTTTSTYKPGGPRGGLILMGHDFDRTITIGDKEIPLYKLLDKTTFPGVQGTPYLNNIAAKAVFFKETLSEKYRARQFKIIENAKRLAGNLAGLGYDVLTNGTDNHMVLVNISNSIEGLTGLIAQQSLEDCGIIINMNKLPYDDKNAKITSGIRLGTPIVTKNGMGNEEIDTITTLIDTALRKVKVISDRKYELDGSVKEEIKEKVKQISSRFPLR
ncbi:MAG: serine hydroxymethyltransferase [Sedimentisphaerales bacterium]|nr:serine hydroxymethyltransferase [Sedimentisphaerales bacterium]